jgi:hypothetical protein
MKSLFKKRPKHGGNVVLGSPFRKFGVDVKGCLIELTRPFKLRILKIEPSFNNPLERGLTILNSSRRLAKTGLDIRIWLGPSHRCNLKS